MTSAADISWDVTLTQLEIMGLLMLLYKQEGEGGLSEPERSAMAKLIYANGILMGFLKADD